MPCKKIDETTENHQPIVITGKRGNAVLVSEEDWNAIAETLHLLSVPGMRESITEDPYQSPPPYEKLVGDLSGAYSRRSCNKNHSVVASLRIKTEHNKINFVSR